jgi:hypothetical protein
MVYICATRDTLQPVILCQQRYLLH